MRSIPAEIGHILLGLLGALALMLVLSTEARASSQLFGTAEITSTNLTRFVKWNRVMDEGVAATPREAIGTLVSAVDGLDTLGQLEAVNAFFNKAPYRSDYGNYGVEDYWATPDELLARGGDCEDYAIAKYLTLRALGVPAETMRIVVLNDLERNLPHAILVVFAEGRAWALDNQLARVTDTRQIHYYRPLYSINEARWWYHLD